MTTALVEKNYENLVHVAAKTFSHLLIANERKSGESDSKDLAGKLDDFRNSIVNSLLIGCFANLWIVFVNKLSICDQKSVQIFGSSIISSCYSCELNMDAENPTRQKANFLKFLASRLEHEDRINFIDSMEHCGDAKEAMSRFCEKMYNLISKVDDIQQTCDAISEEHVKFLKYAVCNILRFLSNYTGDEFMSKMSRFYEVFTILTCYFNFTLILYY